VVVGTVGGAGVAIVGVGAAVVAGGGSVVAVVVGTVTGVVVVGAAGTVVVGVVGVTVAPSCSSSASDGVFSDGAGSDDARSACTTSMEAVAAIRDPTVAAATVAMATRRRTRPAVERRCRGRRRASGREVAVG
jgi:hypothetical protein